MRKERPHISVMRSRSEKQLEDFTNKSRVLKNNMKYLDRPEFAKIEKALNLLDQCIDKVWYLRRSEPDYVPVLSDDDIDNVCNEIYKEYGIEINENPKLCIKCGFIHKPSSKCLDGSEPECN